MDSDKAYVAAGFKYNRGNAARLKARESIQDRIRELMTRAAARVEINASRVLDEIGLIAFASMGDFVNVDEEGNVRLNFPNMSKDALRPVTKIKQRHIRQRDEDGNMETVVETQFELGSKLDALEKLARNLGLYSADNKHEVTIKSVGDALANARQRMNAAKTGK